MTNPESSTGIPSEGSNKYAWNAKPESLEAKLKLLSMLPYHPRARRKHSLVYGFILDWYHSKYGDALASVRHIVAHLQDRDPAGKGLYAGDIHSALSDLVAWGFLDQEKGTGRRANRYVPKWDMLRSVRQTPNASEDERSVLVSPNACVLESPNATDVCVRDLPNEDLSTLTRSQDPGTGVDRYECATPTAPPAPTPLGGGAAVTAQGGFEELWGAYAYRQKKREARAAYRKLAPDADLHARLVEAARAWQVGWARQGKSDAPRYTLAKWIERDEFDCDPPSGFKPKEPPKKDRPKERKAANQDKPAHIAIQPQIAKPAPPEPPKPTSGIYTIERADVVQILRGTDLKILMRREDGLVRPLDITVEHANLARQQEGQAKLSKLCRALALDEVEDALVMIGRRVTITANGDFLPAPANDVVAHAEAA